MSKRTLDDFLGIREVEWKQDQSIQEILCSYFGYSEFRSGQRETIESIRSGQHTMGILPTAAGKTLIFYLSTILMRNDAISTNVSPGWTLVVSPLIALMEDQVARANRRFSCNHRGLVLANTNGISPFAVLLGSAQKDKSIEMHINKGTYPVVYISPEKLGLLPSSALQGISMVVIDECHCVSEHGHTFRPSYLQIKTYLDRANVHAPVLALTATATPRVKNDILSSLGLYPCVCIGTSMYRRNLSLHVHQRAIKPSDIQRIVTSNNEKRSYRTLVYAITKKDCDRMVDALHDLGMKAVSYHAGLSLSTRHAGLHSWIHDVGTIMVATICFGMGVDIPDIRFIIHAGLPKSLMGYVQEIGRGGRDGKQTECHLFYDGACIGKQRMLTTTDHEKVLLHKMYEWAETVNVCRHIRIVSVFGETMVDDIDGCKNINGRPNCDICLSRSIKDTDDGRIENTTITDKLSIDLLRAINETGNYSGKTLPVDYLLGSKNKKVRRVLGRFKNDWSSVYGKGKHIPRTKWYLVFDRLVEFGYIRKILTSAMFIIYKTTTEGHQLLSETM